MCFPLMAIFHSYVRLSLMGLTNSGMIVLIASLKTMMMHMEGKHGLSERDTKNWAAPRPSRKHAAWRGKKWNLKRRKHLVNIHSLCMPIIVIAPFIPQKHDFQKQDSST
jgi:hypothetical protein